MAVVIVMRLFGLLSDEYVAAPGVHLGTASGIDEYEVRVYDTKRGRQLVAAIEIVGPSNKDRPENRRAFAAKTASLLRQDVSVSIVDLVTVRQFNLYADLLELIGGSDPTIGPEPPHLYAATMRVRKPARRKPRLDT